MGEGSTSLQLLNYIQRDRLFQEEKPYIATFDTSKFGWPETNFQFIAQNIHCHHVEDFRDKLNLDINGFQFFEKTTQLLPSDFEDEEIIISRYYPEVIDFVKKARPNATHIDIVSHSRRDSSIREGMVVPGSLYRPVSDVHADFTPGGSSTFLKTYLHNNPEYRGLPYEIINAWRVTEGPTQNWPLALCDYQSISVPEDLEQADIIHPSSVGEQMLLYWNPKHQWYFLREQRVEDLILLRQTDSRGTQIPFAAHASFENLNHREQPRKSIEVRIVCFYE
ncbi:hypothetical protein PENPOL_c012G08216 [Penicillium polonicum]|uniref:Methyltransferase n=1 Tax=Penicillium polonicum TaxID=60169 RepID=A0A1V6NCW7_PENPO|nr:hypothetical protein PENPOL_c012G08216 [Penicillium polonicum]